MEEVKNYNIGTKYRIAIKKESTKGILGYTVEAQDDDIEKVQKDIEILKIKAEMLTPESKVA